MEKIDSEIIISSLFLMGFNQVDSLLYTYTLGKITTDNIFEETFEFKDKETS